MKSADAALLLKVPRNQTALMQYLQLLVIRGHCWHCSGVISADKLVAFAGKMASRYPITRTTRGRAYDRLRGRAAVHLVAFPLKGKQVAWWLLSDEGKGGLNDVSSPDRQVTRNAMAVGGHLTFGDYVLLYAHKKDARTVLDAKTGKEKRILKNCSTWTWKMTETAFNETKAALELAASRLEYGSEGSNGRALGGVLGILICQRSRPLFSGVRTQVIALHRHADTCWGKVRKKWQGCHSALLLTDGESAGELRSLKEIMSQYLPKMTRIPVFGEMPLIVADIAAKPSPQHSR